MKQESPYVAKRNAGSVNYIMATPECSNLQLHQLILESAQSKDLTQLPKNIDSIRRETWKLLKEGLFVIVISQGEYLTNIALQEINDLKTRIGAFFIIGISDKLNSYPPNPLFKFNKLYRLNLALQENLHESTTTTPQH